MKVYKVLRWPILILSLLVLILLVKRPEPLSVQQQPPAAVATNANSFQAKLGELQDAHQRGETGAEVRLSSDEVGSALLVANSEPQAETGQITVTSPPNPSLSNSTSINPEQVRLKDPQVIFEGDQVKGQFAAHVYGKDVFVTVSGHLGAKDAYATFEPTSFKIGSMPVPISMVQMQLGKNSASHRRERN